MPLEYWHILNLGKARSKNELWYAIFWRDTSSGQIDLGFPKMAFPLREKAYGILLEKTVIVS